MLTLCNPMDCSLPGSSVHGILQTNILQWVALPFSRWSSWTRGWTQVSCIAGRFFTVWVTREALVVSNYKQKKKQQHNVLMHSPLYLLNVIHQCRLYIYNHNWKGIKGRSMCMRIYIQIFFFFFLFSFNNRIKSPRIVLNGSI